MLMEVSRTTQALLAMQSGGIGAATCGIIATSERRVRNFSKARILRVITVGGLGDGKMLLTIGFNSQLT